MPIIRAQVILPHIDAVPSHGWSNTFHFDTGAQAPTQALWNDLSGRLFSFYNAVQPLSSRQISSFLSNMISRENAQVRFYDLSQPEPRTPAFIEFDFQFDAADEPGVMADEVRLCASFRGPLVSGTDPRRRRGRVYLGPFSEEANNSVFPNNPRPVALLTNSIVGAIDALKNSNDIDPGVNQDWIVWSEGARDNSVSSGKPWDPGYVHPRNRPLLPPIGTVITYGWCDNSFDTQRKGGSDPTGRVDTDLVN